jgi:hypothetical protein
MPNKISKAKEKKKTRKSTKSQKITEVSKCRHCKLDIYNILNYGIYLKKIILSNRIKNWFVNFKIFLLSRKLKI